MICGKDLSVLIGLYTETKKQASCIDVFSSNTAACFLLININIKEISAIEAELGFL